MEEQPLRNSYQKLKIASINVNSLISNPSRYSLQQFIDKHNPDIILLSETKLNPKYKVHYPNYSIIRTDRPFSTRGGGTAILIKEHIIAYEKIFTPSSNHNELIEYTIIKIKLNNNKKLFIISMYANNQDKGTFINELNYLFQKLNLNNHNNYYILAGDLNARHKRWGDRDINCKGRLLNNWYEDNSINFKMTLYGTLTASFPSANTYLDLCIADSRLIFTDLINEKIQIYSYESDHLALIFTVETTHLDILAPHDAVDINFLYKKTNWKKF